MNDQSDNTTPEQHVVAVSMTRRRRAALGVAGATAVAGAIMVITAVGSSSTAGAAPQGKVTLCHATPPATAANGWHEITPNKNSVIKGTGHDGHAMDIIPAFDYNGGSYPGKNLNTDFGGVTGAEILRNHCVKPGPTDTETSTATVTNTATATETATETATSTATETATETATSTVTNTATATDTETATGTETEVVTETSTAAAGAAGGEQGPIPAGVNAGLHAPDSNAGLKAWGILLLLLGGAAGLIFGLRPAGRRAH
jgi:hypothetical protein